jgi:hypothetical protein
MIERGVVPPCVPADGHRAAGDAFKNRLGVSQ